ncbi:hypothetical protein EEDFHM_04086 [Methylorubrum populi]
MTNMNASESALPLAVEGSPLDLEAEVARINDLTAQAKDYEAQGHRRTYQRIAAMLGFVERVRNNPLYAEPWGKMLAERQIPVPGEGVNEFNQYIRVLAGSYVTEPSKKKGSEGETVTRWKHDRSCEKISKIVRWCVENDVKSDAAADRIENFVNPDNPKETGMLGIERADTRAHPSTPRVSKLKAAEQKAIREAEGVFKLPSSLKKHLKFHGGFAVAILREDDDSVALLDDAGLTANQVINAVKRRKGAIAAEKA